MRKYTKNGKPIHRAGWLPNSDYDIIGSYQAEYRGLVNYYIMAHNVHLSEVESTAATSLLKTLAGKYKTSVAKIAKQYKATTGVGDRSYRIFQATVERKGRNR